MTPWSDLQKNIVACEKCPRLRAWCKKIAIEKRAAFKSEKYWGRPIPNLGTPDARLLIVGLAPAAHGGNRTGRLFTGDRSGDFLFQALYDTGFANQPTSKHAGDGLQLVDAVITAVNHCAPPANKLTPQEIANCSPYLERTLDLMRNLRGIVCLGGLAFNACVSLYRRRGWLADRPAFGHGALVEPAGAPFLLACFHPSQQNTFTGRLTPEMMRDVFSRAASLIKGSRRESGSRDA